MFLILDRFRLRASGGKRQNIEDTLLFVKLNGNIGNFNEKNKEKFNGKWKNLSRFSSFSRKPTDFCFDFETVLVRSESFNFGKIKEVKIHWIM
jgi:hypothetical protein